MTETTETTTERRAPDPTRTLELEVERADRFRRVATQRANKALGYIEGLMRTSDRARYAYTDEQVAEILGKFRQAVDQLEASFSRRERSLRVDL